jgi:hypothetical protein
MNNEHHAPSASIRTTWFVILSSPAIPVCQGFILVNYDVKPPLNNLRVHIGYEDDGHLLHTDKGRGKQRIRVETWLDVASAKEGVVCRTRQNCEKN